MGLFDRFKKNKDNKSKEIKKNKINNLEDIEKLDASENFKDLIDIAISDKNSDRGIAALMKLYNKENNRFLVPMALEDIASKSSNPIVASKATALLNEINGTGNQEEIKTLDSMYFTALLGESLNEDRETTLECDFKFNLPVTLSVGDIVIDGNGHAIYGSENTPIIIDANNITFKNINFKNFSGNNHGGVIKNQGKSIKIENCTFEGNKIVKAVKSDSERFGGAISNHGTMEIVNCKFKKNQADSGACIHTENGISEFENCIFEDNFANLSGGGALSVFNADIKVKDSTFKKNESRNFSGAIRVSKGNAEIESSTFIDNDAVQHGGAISINEGTLKIYSSTFEGNKGLNGGAINQPGGSLVLKDCIFNDNVSKNGSEGSVYTNGNIEESNCKFKTKNDEIYR